MNKICRICLEEGVLSSIFTRNYNISVCEMIEYCCNIKICKDDGLPEQLCSNCIYKLRVAYHFKQTSESSDIRLRQYLGLQIPNKYNDAAVMTDPVPTHTTHIIKRCKCRLAEQKTSSTNYKKKPESEKLKRGPKPKPKTVHACYQCDKQFRCQAQLNMHVRTHTGDKPYVCMYCRRSFTQKHNLKIHLRIHTGEKPFQCEVCSKTFSAQSNLQTHLKIHTGQRDHPCTLCNKSFITSSELTRHMNKHRGIKSFKCDMCECAYIYSKDLKCHKLKKHQVATQNKRQIETLNNSSNIDIIGIDVGKDGPPAALKESNHHMPHAKNEKEQQNIPIVTEHNHTLLQYHHKALFHPYTNKVVNQTHNCAVCGQQFDYINELSQHYLNRHKGYDPTQRVLI